MKTILVDAWDTLVTETWIFVEMQKLLDTYPNRKIILTNANDEQMLKYGLVNMPYEMFSLKHNPDKIDPLYFQTMLKQFNLDTDDVIYFEHSQEAINSALSLGIVAYFYDKDKKDLVALKTFIDKYI